ncbi:aspartate-tRNA(Asn) ligase [Verruconis gallopava]|uniref:Probable aspartate--tRNA ligase, cytoplasmic n=1 Tax=Verruconis gallopava TaxID=253628 RepID=A0A0D1YJN7_9PEZI|nr:aspartate-tRNA(Asn) ligase [Verruconis gallopava]KIW01062.1 aspartate-tRNA(Asn) ligase [Verruconis gallopava]
MADEQKLPERPAEGAEGSAEGGEKLSKKALKKLEKEREKAAKKAEQEKAAAEKKAQEDANDVSKGKYGDTPLVGSGDYKPLSQKRFKLHEVAGVDNGTEVLVRCKVDNARSQSAKLGFLLLSHGPDSIQAVVAASETISRQMVKFAANIPPESIVDVVGLAKDVPEPIKSASISNKELHIVQIWVISRAISKLPIQVADADTRLPSEDKSAEQEEGGRALVGLNTRLDNRVLDLRSPLNRAIFKVRNGVKKAFTQFLTERGFIDIDTPKLLGSPSEGGANVFVVEYYKGKGYLAQSPQFYKEMAISAGFERVFEISDVFRAEDSNTSRHLSEYTSMDLEMEFTDDYMEVVHLIRDLMHYILATLAKNFSREIEYVRGKYPSEPFKLPEKSEDIPIIEFEQGCKWLNEAGIEVDDSDDVNSQQEKALGNIVREKFGTDVYILNGYPHKARAFYTMPRNADLGSKYSNSFDFMMRGQEVLSGAQRIHDHVLLSKKMRSWQPPLDPESAGFKDYVDAFKYGCPPHAGGAFGLERVVSNYLALQNVRQASLFPRDPSRLTP